MTKKRLTPIDVKLSQLNDEQIKRLFEEEKARRIREFKRDERFYLRND